MDSRTNYYGSLCSELYDILHPEAPRDELEFYLSYAEKGHSILEALCGSGRFLIPFAERGLSIAALVKQLSLQSVQEENNEARK